MPYSRYCSNHYFLFILIFFSFLNLFSNLFAQNDKVLGVGIILGEPTGLSFKKWQSQKVAWDAAVAWSFGKESALHLHVDYLLHDFHSLKVETNSIPFYYGIGARIKFKESSKLGIRFPLGVNLFIVEVPVDIFFEIVPILNVVPSTKFNMNAAFGARYYFR